MSYLCGDPLFAIGLAWFGFGYLSIVGGIIAESVLRTIFALLAYPIPVDAIIRIRAAWAMVAFGFGQTLSQMANLVATRGDSLVVGKRLGAQILGEYDRAYQLMVMPAALFGQVVGRVLFSAVSRVRDDLEALRESFGAAVEVTLLVTAPFDRAHGDTCSGNC